MVHSLADPVLDHALELAKRLTYVATEPFLELTIPSLPEPLLILMNSTNECAERCWDLWMKAKFMDRSIHFFRLI